MKNSPLRLEKSFFTRVLIQAERDGNPEAKWEVEAIPEVAKQGEDKRKWAVVLKVKIKPLSDLKPPYQVEVEAAGSFSVEEPWPEANIEQLVHVNGPAVLYSAIREMICGVTCRGPWAMLFLPTVSFVDSYKAATPQVPAKK